MNIPDVMAAAGGIADRPQLLRTLGRSRLDNAVKTGELCRLLPRVFVLPWDADQVDVRRRAALLSVGGDAALSHLTTLELAGLPVPPGEPMHVTAYLPRHPRGVRGVLVVHRTRQPLQAVERGSLPTVRLETALATSWPLLAGADQRAPLIEAYRRRLISAARLREACELAWWVRDARGLRSLASMVLGGCESQLELWGYTSVFDIPGLDDGYRQLTLRIGAKAYRVDLAYEAERLAVEIDGRAYHASPAQWDRDIARDLALATIGWQTIRFSHARLVGDVDGCRRDVFAVRAARRRAA